MHFLYYIPRRMFFQDGILTRRDLSFHPSRGVCQVEEINRPVASPHKKRPFQTIHPDWVEGLWKSDREYEGPRQKGVNLNEAIFRTGEKGRFPSAWPDMEGGHW